MYYVRLFSFALIIFTIFISLFSVAPVLKLSNITSWFNFNLQNFFIDVLAYFCYFFPIEWIRVFIRSFVFWSSLRLSIAIFNKSKDLIFTAK